MLVSRTTPNSEVNGELRGRPALLGSLFSNFDSKQSDWVPHTPLPDSPPPRSTSRGAVHSIVGCSVASSAGSVSLSGWIVLTLTQRRSQSSSVWNRLALPPQPLQKNWKHCANSGSKKYAEMRSLQGPVSLGSQQMSAAAQRHISTLCHSARHNYLFMRWDIIQSFNMIYFILCSVSVNTHDQEIG